MTNYLMKSVRYNPPLNGETVDHNIQLSALVLEVSETGVANLTVFNPTGSSEFVVGVRMALAGDDRSVATWEPVVQD